MAHNYRKFGKLSSSEAKQYIKKLPFNIKRGLYSTSTHNKLHGKEGFNLQLDNFSIDEGTQFLNIGKFGNASVLHNDLNSELEVEHKITLPPMNKGRKDFMLIEVSSTQNKDVGIMNPSIKTPSLSTKLDNFSKDSAATRNMSYISRFKGKPNTKERVRSTKGVSNLSLYSPEKATPVNAAHKRTALSGALSTMLKGNKDDLK